MNSQKFIIKEIRGFKDPLPFGRTVYNNFSYLSNDKSVGHNMNEILRLLRDENFVGYMVYWGSKVVGYLVGEKKVLNDGRMVYYITYFFVSDKFRNKKIGTQLLLSLIRRCQEWGIRFIMLTCDINNKKAFGFYKKIGFVDDPILNAGKIDTSQTQKVLLLYI